jgi:hypothetical protein
MDQRIKLQDPPDQDAPAYMWLEENTSLLADLSPSLGAEPYRRALEKIASAGKDQLAHADPEDPALSFFLSLLTTEAQIDLAMVADEPDKRGALISEGCESCRGMLVGLEKQNMSGFAAIILPRILVLLSGAFLAASPNLRPEVENCVKQASDLLDEFRLRQTCQRELAAQRLLEGRILALSISGMPDPTDRRLVLQKAGASLRQAAGLSALALDDELGKEVETCLIAVAQSLSSADLPIPVFFTSGIENMQTNQALVCKNCGADLAPTSRFCANCGQSTVNAA